MSRLGTVTVLLALGVFGAFARAQDAADTLPDPSESPWKSHFVPVGSLTNTMPKLPVPDAPVSTKSTGIVNTMAAKPAPAPAAPKKPDPKDPKKALAAGVGNYGPAPGGTTGGAGGGGAKGQFVNTELKWPTEDNGAGGEAKVAKGANGPSATGSGGSSAGAGSGAPYASATRGGSDREESPGLPAPGSRSGGATPTPAAAATPKKSFLEGHVVLFLRAPGDEDPSPAGVKARFSKEAKVVKRLAGEVQKGEKPSTKPEEAVLRDAAPQGFYLPDEVDAWLVTTDGTLVLLDAEGTTFDKIAALALSSRLNVSGPQSELALDGATVTKTKVIAMSTDGSEPKIDGGAAYGGGRAPAGDE